MPAVIKSMGYDLGGGGPGVILRGGYGGLSIRKWCTPENRHPGKTKSWVLSFLVSAGEATLNLRGPRIEI